MARWLLPLFLLSACDLLGSSECTSGATRPCSCFDQPVNGVETCAEDGMWGRCACPSPEAPPPPLEREQRSALDLARISLVSTLAAIETRCASESDEDLDLTPYFHSSASERLVGSICGAIDENGVDAFRRDCEGRSEQCADGGDAPEELRPNPTGCYAFRAGEAFVAACIVEGSMQLVHHEGLASLKAPPRPAKRPDYLQDLPVNF